MFLVSLMQYTFLASIAFDVAVAVWFVKNSIHSTIPVIRSYYVTLSLIVGWELTTYISFFFQRSENFNFIFNASTFAFGLSALFSVIYFTWLFLEKKYLSKVVVYLLTSLTVVVAAVSFIPHAVVGQKIYAAEGILFYLNSTHYTIAFYSLAIVNLVLLIGLLFYGYKKSVGRKKVEAKLLIIGFGTASFIGVLTHAVIPLVANTVLQSDDLIANSVATQQIIGSISSSIISVTIAYAILRYRIFTIHYQIRRDLIVVLIYFIILLILGGVLLKIFSSPTIVRSVMLTVFMIIIILTGPLIKRSVDWLIRCLFPERIFDFYKLTDEEQTIMDAMPSPVAAVRIAISHFVETVPVEHIVLYGLDNRNYCFTALYPNDGSKVDLNQDLENLARKQKCVRVQPIYYNQVMIALFGLGRRINQQDFSNYDERYITSFTRFMGYHLWNVLNLQAQTYSAMGKGKQSH